MLRVGVFSTQRLHCTSWTEAITLMVIFGAVRSGRDAWDRHLNDTMNQGSRDIMIQMIWGCKMLQKCDGYNGSGNYFKSFRAASRIVSDTIQGITKPQSLDTWRSEGDALSQDACGSKGWAGGLCRDQPRSNQQTCQLIRRMWLPLIFYLTLDLTSFAELEYHQQDVEF